MTSRQRLNVAFRQAAYQEEDDIFLRDKKKYREAEK